MKDIFRKTFRFKKSFLCAEKGKPSFFTKITLYENVRNDVLPFGYEETF